MMNFICAGNGAGTIVYTVIILVVLVAMLILPMFTQRRKNREYAEMLSSIKVGDLVKTAGGIIGRITKISDKGDIKTVILETGSKTEKSYMEFDMSMIYCVMKSTKVENAEEPDELAEDETPAVEEVKSEVEAVEPKKEEVKKAAKKTTAKKTTSKKTTTKK